MAEHCWHAQDESEREVCCWCGERSVVVPSAMNESHGPWTPSLRRKTVRVGGDNECPGLLTSRAFTPQEVRS